MVTVVVDKYANVHAVKYINNMTDLYKPAASDACSSVGFSHLSKYINHIASGGIAMKSSIGYS